MNPYQGQYCRDVDPNSAIAKMEHTYWVTKQNILKRIGKKEDECIVASDAELDAKLELFRSIQESCIDLQKIIDRYQDRFCGVAQEENAMGRFLKESGASDTSRAGKMMINVGKVMSYCGKQRLTLRPPLFRLGQEVETFRLRAIADTLNNLKEMEKSRNEYRAGLSWMKDVSQELDPERQLDKFRKVQAHVRRSKVRFDQLKLDCLQKVDLLAAARCNMFSHALVLYHKMLLEFCVKAAHAFQTVANSCKGYQHYEFNIVKELTEPSLKLAEQLNANRDREPSDKQTDSDILLFFDSEYHDDEQQQPAKDKESTIETTAAPSQTETLLDLSSLTIESTTKQYEESGAHMSTIDLGQQLDLASGIELLEGLYQKDIAGDDNWSREWEDVFGKSDSPKKASLDSQAGASCFPSSLLEQTPLWNQTTNLADASGNSASAKLSNLSLHGNKTLATKKEDINAWYNLFADLDPLADPDTVGAKALVDRNC